MSVEEQVNPALIAARAADAQVMRCLHENKSFLLEAGAGAGKTYSLVETLRFLIRTEGPRLKRRGQRIACITYTNAATAVINSRIDSNPVVVTETIHVFCWALICGFQGPLRAYVATLPEWQEKLLAAGGLGSRKIEYDLGHRRVLEDAISLHHDDVLALTVALLPSAKFQDIVADKFPFILIDEYQDTNNAAMDAIKEHLLLRPNGPLIGLFGDHWQRIYDKTCGKVSNARLTEIGKGANFRSAKSVVAVLNNMRPDLPQAVKDETFVGSATAYYSNAWVGVRRTGGHWKGDLPPEEAHRYLQGLKARLEGEGWDFAHEGTKVLMLTHGALATEQGYSSLAKVFSYTDSYIKKEDDYIAFFADQLEPACAAYEARRFGEMFEYLGSAAPKLSAHADKIRWSAAMDNIIAARMAGTVGDVVTVIRSQGELELPDKMVRRDTDALLWQGQPGEAVPDKIALTRALRDVPYREILALRAFINGHTPFATKHSVKGDEFENVLVVLGRGWNKYNFEQFLELAGQDNISADKVEMFERNRNLFYVSCSRPTTRLALLFTQQLSDVALQTLKAWFGTAHVHSFSP